MQGLEYQCAAMRTNDGKATERVIKAANGDFIDLGGMLNAALGLSGETGELNDMLKKAVFHEKELDYEHFKKELGDVLWYVAMMCDAIGVSLDEIMQLNVDKLLARYPQGFDVKRANNRAKDDV